MPRKVCRPTPKETAYALDACRVALILLKQILGGKPNPETLIDLAAKFHELDGVIPGGIFGLTVEARADDYERRIVDLLETPLYDEAATYIEVDYE